MLFVIRPIFTKTDIYTDVYGKTPKGMERRQSDRRFLDFTDYEYSAPDVDFTNLDGLPLYLYLNLADPTLMM